MKNKILLLISLFLILSSCHRRSVDGLCCTELREFGPIGSVATKSIITVPVVFHTSTELSEDIITNVNTYLKDAGIIMRLDSVIYFQPQYFLEDIVLNGKKENQLTENEVEGFLNIFVVPTKNDLQGYLPTPVDASYLSEQKYQRMFIYMEDEITIIHEFGHWGGLGHKFECKNIMGYDCFRDTLYSYQYDSLKQFITKYRTDYIE